VSSWFPKTNKSLELCEKPEQNEGFWCEPESGSRYLDRRRRRSASRTGSVSSWQQLHWNQSIRFQLVVSRHYFATYVQSCSCKKLEKNASFKAVQNKISTGKTAVNGKTQKTETEQQHLKYVINAISYKFVKARSSALLHTNDLHLVQQKNWPTCHYAIK